MSPLDLAIAATVGMIGCAGWLAWLCWSMRPDDPPSLVDEAKRDEALKAILRKSYEPRPWSAPATKGFREQTKDDAVVTFPTRRAQ
jgi:hypothetical protein